MNLKLFAQSLTDKEKEKLLSILLGEEEKPPKPVKVQLNPDNYKCFREVCSYFDEKFYNEQKWLDCYDKLVRIDKYDEYQILEIVKRFRKPGEWWHDTGNFQSLLKLRQSNRVGVKYITFFDGKLIAESTNNIKSQTQNTIHDIQQRISSTQ